MKVEDLAEWFNANFDEYLHFERVDDRITNRPDLEAFIMLDKQYDGDVDILGGANHDEVFLNVDINKVDLTEGDVIKLLRCGVRYDPYNECLSMFV